MLDLAIQELVHSEQELVAMPLPFLTRRIRSSDCIAQLVVS
jgi:hypothetical protein